MGTKVCGLRTVCKCSVPSPKKIECRTRGNSHDWTGWHTIDLTERRKWTESACRRLLASLMVYSTFYTCGSYVYNLGQFLTFSWLSEMMDRDSSFKTIVCCKTYVRCCWKLVAIFFFLSQSFVSISTASDFCLWSDNCHQEACRSAARAPYGCQLRSHDHEWAGVGMPSALQHHPQRQL